MSSRTARHQENSLRSYTVVVALIGVVLFGGWLAWRYYTVPPQLQASAAATKTLDALFTALTARDSVKLKACMERIEGHSAAGHIGTKGLAEVRHCSQLAEKGAWEEAAKRLYWIVYDQR